MINAYPIPGNSKRCNVLRQGIIHGCDWYATFAALAGEDPTDHDAAASGLPAIDGLNVCTCTRSAAITLARRTRAPTSLIITTH